MPSPSGETELRKLRERIQIRKHYEDAYNASALRLVPAEYPSALFAVNHVALNGVRGDGVLVDRGHASSRPPAHDLIAMKRLRYEQAHIGERGKQLLLWLDGYVHGEYGKYEY